MENINISHMPENPRLAFAYIAFQQWLDDTYDLEKGFYAGTIFPGLDQPMSDYEVGGCKC